MFQRKFLIKTGIGLLLIFCSCREVATPLPFYNSPDFTPLFGADSVKVSHVIGAFSFTDQHGTTITEQQLNGKVHIANFIFTRCNSICPVLTRHMKLLQASFANDSNVVLLSFSVTPWIDSVSRLQQYALSNGISSPRWHLLTGAKDQVYTLARQSYFAEEDLGFSRDSSDFLHTEHVLLVDKKRRIRGIYNGTLQLDMEQLITDIQTLRKE